MKYITRTITTKRVRYIAISFENGTAVSNVLGEEILPTVPGPRAILNWKKEHEIPESCNVVVDAEDINNVYRMPVEDFIKSAELVIDEPDEE